MQTRRRSRFWFLLPIVFNVIGGVIAYYILKEDDLPKAKNCLYLGLVLAIIPILLIVIPIVIGISLMPRPAPAGHFM